MTLHKQLRRKKRSNGKLINYSRYVMEQYLGRKLKLNEMVHHINENVTDDRIENLQLMTKAKHQKHHLGKGRTKGYAKRNKERLKIYRKEYYQKNRERILKRQKAYYQRNKDKKAEYDRNYYQKNKEKISKRQKAHRKRKKEDN